MEPWAPTNPHPKRPKLSTVNIPVPGTKRHPQMFPVHVLTSAEKAKQCPTLIHTVQPGLQPNPDSLVLKFDGYLDSWCLSAGP